MSELKSTALDIEAFFKLSYGLYVVSTKAGARQNGYISNAVFQVTAEPARFAICCSRDNFSAEMIKESGIFSISVLKKGAAQELISLFGYRSGRDVNKFEKVKYQTGITGVPVVTEDTLAWFECRVGQIIDVDSHLLFTAEIVNSAVIDSTEEPLTYAWYRENRKAKAPKNAPTYISDDRTGHEETENSGYRCVICGHIYSPAQGDPERGIKPGTPFESLNEDWKCPVCGTDKQSFEKVE
jgi:flavin reductase (DIM6/NTAB) family NADH-FMN oxidoreductase RutF/rubredoxin